MLTFALNVNDAGRDKPRSQVPGGPRRLACQPPQGRSDPACAPYPRHHLRAGSERGIREEG
jgi:hypothetical protein